MTNLPTLKVNDIPDGAMGEIYTIINGERVHILNCVNITVDVDKSKKSIKVMGCNVEKHKATGWTGKGSMEVYYGPTPIDDVLIKYMTEGVDTYFDIVIRNSDPGTNIGSKTLLVSGVNIDNGNLAKLDVNNSELTSTVNFTYQKVSVLETFNGYEGE